MFQVCFLCMRTRFTLFSWGVRCALCCRQVCAKCSGRMRIPLEHFSAVPVFALSPPPAASPLISPDGSVQQGRRRLSSASLASPKPRDRLSCVVPPSSSTAAAGSRSGAGSAPTSPAAGRRRSFAQPVDGSSSGGGGSPAGPTSLPVFTSQGPTTISAR